MSSFRHWLEALESDKDKQIQAIWADTFKALGVGGFSDEDAAHQSLSKITYGQRRGMRSYMDSESGTSTFKGKKAAYKRLENGQIFNRLAQLNDPEISKNIEDTKAWLGQNNVKNNGDTTISTVLQKLFGPERFEQLIDSDVPHVDSKLTKAPAQPPKQDMGMNQPEPQMEQPPDMSQDPNMAQPAFPAQQQQQKQPMQQGMALAASVLGTRKNILKG